MIFTAKLGDAELKNIIKKSVEQEMPGHTATSVTLRRIDNQREADTFEASVSIVPAKAVVPAPDEPEYTAEIRDWVRLGGVVYGSIYGDKKGRFPDGAHIHTSPGRMKDGLFVTLNSTYKLIGEGKPQ